MSIEGEVRISLSDYEALKSTAKDAMQLAEDRKQQVAGILKGADELKEFFDFVAERVPAFQEIVNAFNSTTERVEIVQEKEEGSYRIKFLDHGS